MNNTEGYGGACDGTLFEALSSCLTVCVFIEFEYDETPDSRFCVHMEGKKALIGASWFLRSGPPVYLSYNNALKALTHVDNTKVSQLAATV